MKKIILIVIVALICLVGLFILFLPSILSSDAGKNYLIRQIEERTRSNVRIETISLSWTKAQKIDRFQLEKKGEAFLTFDSLTLDTSFWNLLFRKGSLGETSLVKPQLILTAKTAIPSPPPQQKPGIPKVKAAKKPTTWSDLSGKISIQEGVFALQQSEKDLIRMDDIDFTLDMPKNLFPISIATQGKTRYNQLLGSFQASGTVEKKKEIIELESAEALQIDGEANFSNFPVAGVDALNGLINPSMKGLLLETFGDHLNLDLLFNKVAEGQNFSIRLRSPRMMVSFLGDYQKGIIHLRDPLKAVWTIRPLLMQTLMPNMPLVLIGDMRAEIDLDSMSLLFKNMKFDIRSMAMAGKLNMQRGAFALAETRDSLLLDQLDLSFDTDRLEELVNLSFQNTFRFSSFPQTKVEGSSTLKQFFAKKDWLAKLSQLDLNMRNFPTALIEQLTSSSGKMQKWIGSNFDITAQRFEQGNDQKLVLSGSSPILNLATSRFTVQENVILTAPTTFTYKVAPSQWEQLAHPISLTGNIDNLKIPMKNKKLEWASSQLSLSFKTQDIQIKDFLALGGVQVPFLNAQISGSPGQALNFKGTSKLDFAPETWGLSLFGQNVEVQTTGNIKMQKELEISPLNIKLDGRKFKSSIYGALQSGAFVLKKPLDIDFMLEPNQINPILSKDGNFPLLAENTPFRLQVRPGTFPLKKEAFSQLELKATGAIASLKMIQPKTRFPFSFENVNLDFDLNGKKKMSRVELDANALEQEQPKGKIELLVENDQGDKNPLKNPSRTFVRFDHLSTSIGDALFRMNGALPPMIGSWLDFHFDVKKEQNGHDIELDLKSPYLKMNGSFNAYDKFELKSNRNPLKIDWNISEEGYAAYKKWRNPTKAQKAPTFVIKDRTNVKLSVAPLAFPIRTGGELFPKVDTNLYHSIFDADMRINSLTFKQQRTGEETELDRFDLNLHKKAAPGPLTFEMQGNVKPQGTGKSGQIKGTGKLDDFLTPQGAIDLEDITASIHAKIQHLPTVFLDALSNIKDPSGAPPSAFLGDLVNASLDVELIKENGRLNIDVDGTNCRANLAGTVANGILYLNEPLKATMTISPKMNEILAKSAKVVVASMKNPIGLVISDKGFSVPIKSLALKSTNLSYGMIDFGQITCRNTGSTSDVSGIFKMEGDQNLISSWFAPMEFNIRNGLMYVDRTEILYNRAYQVALWGDINFVRRYVAMTLGLTAQSLRAALGISGLDPDYVLQVPVEGPFDNVRIDKGAATSKIALLITRKQIAPQAGVWGQVFGAIGGLADDQSGVPPAKPPFPWQNVINLQELTTTDKDLKKLFKKKAKAYKKEIEKLSQP